jgi:hypothetical protein
LQISPLSRTSAGADSDDLDDFIFVQVFEACRRYYVLIVLFREEQARVSQSLAVERVRVFEYLTERFNRNVLGQDLLALLLERGHVEAISQRQQLVDVLALDFYVVRVDVAQEHQEEVVRYIVVSRNALFLLSEVMRELSFKISGP